MNIIRFFFSDTSSMLIHVVAFYIVNVSFYILSWRQQFLAVWLVNVVINIAKDQRGSRSISLHKKTQSIKRRLNFTRCFSEFIREFIGPNIRLSTLLRLDPNKLYQHDEFAFLWIPNVICHDLSQNTSKV